ncbi:MAG: hypothetical protein WAM82_22905 [Thermoanaerobaculia bacterium]
MQQALLIWLVVLQALSLSGVVWLWLQSRQAKNRQSLPSIEDWRREFRALEKYVESKTDLLLTQILAQKPQSLDLKPLTDALALQADFRKAGQLAEPRRAPQHDNQEDEAVASLHLDQLPQLPRREEQDSLALENLLARELSAPGFLAGVWPGMEGAFEEASKKLLDYFRNEGLAEPIIEPYPSVERGGSNHWFFLSVAYRDPQKDCRRFLIPRNYSRYDPLVHDHLFEVLGASGSVDLFVKELRRCALLEAQGSLEGFISKDLVVRRGTFVV